MFVINCTIKDSGTKQIADIWQHEWVTWITNGVGMCMIVWRELIILTAFVLWTFLASYNKLYKVIVPRSKRRRISINFFPFRLQILAGYLKCQMFHVCAQEVRCWSAKSHDTCKFKWIFITQMVGMTLKNTNMCVKSKFYLPIVNPYQSLHMDCE